MNKRILVVDDDLLLREIYVEELKRQGYIVLSAANGEQAVNKIQEGNWDLVLLDVLMPKLTGFEVVRNLKKNREKPYYKHLVFLTNLEEKKDLDEAKRLGDGYMIKTELTPAEFSKAVAHYLSL